MGMTSASFNVACFKVISMPEGIEDCRTPYEFIGGVLEENHFTPIDELPREEYSAGWVKSIDPTAGMPISNTKDHEYYIEGWVFFTFRYDKRSIPGKNLMQELKKEINNWLISHPSYKKPSARVKAELRQQCIDRLLPKTLPRQNSVDVAWHLEDNKLLIFSASQKQIDAVEDNLMTDFPGLTLRPVTPIELYGSFGPQHAALNQACSDNVLDLLAYNQWLGRDAALFALFRSASLSVDYNGGLGALSADPQGTSGYNLYYDSKAVLEHKDSDVPRKATLVGHISDTFDEIKAGLQNRLELKEVKIGVESDEGVFRARVNLTTFDLCGVRLPKSVLELDAEDDPEVIFAEMVLDRLLYLKQLHKMLTNYLLIFATIRSNKAQWCAWSQAIWSWIHNKA